MNAVRALLVPTGPVHLACLLSVIGALTAVLMGIGLYPDASAPILIGLCLLAVGLVVTVWGLWRLKRWGWAGALGLFALLWLLSMQQAIWGGIFFSLGVAAYLVWIRDLFG